MRFLSAQLQSPRSAARNRSPHITGQPVVVSQAQTFKCPQCGCTQSIAALDALVEEHDLDIALSDAGKAHGYGREMKAVTCSVCGATTQHDPGVASTACPFCGSQQVLEQPPDPNIVQPESVIPFQLTSDQAYQNYKKWLGKGFFRPRDVLQKSGATQMQGVYLPFWTFDAHADSNWRAESGDYYYVTERYTATENGRRVTKERRVQKVRWYPSWGTHADDYDDVLVSGSTSGDQAMLRRIEPFGTTRLAPYKPDYLSGWAAEAYRIPLAQAWANGQEIIRGEERGKCARQVPGDTHRNLNAGEHALLQHHVQARAAAGVPGALPLQHQAVPLHGQRPDRRGAGPGAGGLGQGGHPSWRPSRLRFCSSRCSSSGRWRAPPRPRGRHCAQSPQCPRRSLLLEWDAGERGLTQILFSNLRSSASQI